MLKRAVQKDGSQPLKPNQAQSYSYIAPAKSTQAAISSKFGVVAPSSSPSKDTSTLKSSRTTLLNEKASRFAITIEDDSPPSSSSQNPKKRPADDQTTGLSLKRALCTDSSGGFSGASQVMDTVYYEEGDFDLSDDDEFSLPSLPKVTEAPKATATTMAAPSTNGSAAILNRAYSTAPVMKRVVKQVTNTETTSTTSASVSSTSTSISTSTSTSNTSNTSASTGAFSAAYSQINNHNTSLTSRPSIFSSPRVNNSISNNDPIPSSQRALPWSSSPPSHLDPPSQPRQPQHPAPFKPPVSQQPLKLSSTSQNGPSKARLLQPKPASGRVLPWMKNGAAATSSASVSSSTASRSYATSTKSEQAPRSMTPQKRPSPHEPNWDVSMSAVKETQRRIKESTKQTTAAKESWRTPDAAKQIAPVFLSEEQQAVIKMVLEEKSVFFTGSAGTGKSVLMREIISALRRKYRHEPDRVAVTASTGLAACNIGGVTIHSFSGIGLGKENAEFLIKKVKKNPKARTRWQRTKFLIIDEISMVDGELFDKLEAIARALRNNGHPFGGIKLVVTGDFFQLPPVPDGGRVARFAFEAEKWGTCINETIGLTHVFRQKDPEFAKMLNELRIGRPSKETILKFQSLDRPITYTDGLQATELFPTRNEVDRSNLNKMKTLPGQSYIFHAADGGTITDQTARNRLLNNCMAPASLELKTGAQVLLIKNHDETLVNGSLGRIKGFMTERTYEIIVEHGSEFDKAMGWDDSSKMNKKNKKLKALMNGGAAADTGRAWPLVEFAMPDGTTRSLLCSPETWKVELPNGEVQASRAQVPLILAWALSIHKAQGQTLERVKVDLSKVFEKGQAYVALSRATNQEGLQVLGFNPSKVIAHEKVRAFYDSLYSAQQALVQSHGPPPAIAAPPPAPIFKKQEDDRNKRREEERKRQKRIIDLEEEYPTVNEQKQVQKNRDDLFADDEQYFEDFDTNTAFPDELEEELFGNF